MKYFFTGFVKVAALSLTITSLCIANGFAERDKPNIILVVADDLGFGDVGCYTGFDIKTPNIDSLARDGIKCTEGYAGAPICAPSRAALMLGMYEHRIGFETIPSPEYRAWKERLGVDPSKKMLPQLLRENGYKTGLVGKWHLGVRPEFHPNTRGFDYFYGFTGGMHSYFPDHLQWYDHGNDIERNGEEVEWTDYLTCEFTREACEFIGRNQKSPFFLYLAYNTPHDPMEAPQEYIDRFNYITDPKRRLACAMIAAMDDGIGCVMKKLREYGLEKNTLIVFSSDNGALSPMGTSNLPLDGLKGRTQEGGVRVPFILHWEDRLPAGAIYQKMVSFMDLFPTFAGLAGTSMPANQICDGVDLMPFLCGQNNEWPHESLCWRLFERSGIRHKAWKLVRWKGVPSGLFNLTDDLSERNNLIEKMPEMAATLNSMYLDWERRMAPAAFANPTPENYKEASRLAHDGIDFWKSD